MDISQRAPPAPTSRNIAVRPVGRDASRPRTGFSPPGLPAVRATVAHTRVATRNADIGTIPACGAQGAVMACAWADHRTSSHRNAQRPLDLNARRRVARRRDGEAFKVHAAGRAAGRQRRQFAARLQDAGANGTPTDMRFEGLKGAFEIGAEGGEQPVQGGQGGARQALDRGAVREADTRLKAGGGVQGVDGGAQGWGVAVGGGEGGVRRPAPGGAGGTAAAPAVAGIAGQGVHGVPEQAAGERGEDGEAGARVRVDGVAPPVRVRGAAQGVRQQAARAGVEAARPQQSGERLRGVGAAGNFNVSLEVGAGDAIADPEAAPAGGRPGRSFDKRILNPERP